MRFYDVFSWHHLSPSPEGLRVASTLRQSAGRVRERPTPNSLPDSFQSLCGRHLKRLFLQRLPPPIVSDQVFEQIADRGRVPQHRCTPEQRGKTAEHSLNDKRVHTFGVVTQCEHGSIRRWHHFHLQRVCDL